MTQKHSTSGSDVPTSDPLVEKKKLARASGRYAEDNPPIASPPKNTLEKT
jgi:hypothetical protein